MATMSFPNQPMLTFGHLVGSPTPVLAQCGSGDGGGFMLVSGSSGRRWHVIRTEQACQFGHVLLAVEVACSPSTGSWQVQGRGRFAIKLQSWVNSLKPQTQKKEAVLAEVIYQITSIAVLMRTNLEPFLSVDGSAVNKNPIREISALQYLTANGPHPNIIETIEVLQKAGNIYTIMPYCQGGELFSVLQSSTRLTESTSKIIFGDVLAGMSYLHALGICHRDMSTENILLDGNRRAKIIDFGMALMVGQPHGVSSGSRRSIPPTGPCGKIRYMAPEVAMGNRAYDGFAVDVWACGIILFMMIAGFHPFGNQIPTEDERYEVIAVTGHLQALARSWGLPMSDEVIDLIQSCLQRDPRRRPTIDHLRHHRWFTT